MSFTGEVNGCADRYVTKLEQTGLITFDLKEVPEVIEEIVHLELLSSCVRDIRQLNPL
jgi:hypothetical protein